MAKLKALVVEDDKKYAEKLANFLKIGFDCEITMKFSGEDAIVTLDKEKFQIMLLDLQMPGIDGFSVLAHARKLYPNLVVIVISGIIDASVEKRAEDMGAWFMNKPVGIKEVEHVLKSLLKKQGLVS